jgi:L-iditol 2-dehydrogenase
MSATMWAQVLHAVGDMRYEQVPRPVPGPGQVLVRVAWCGLCGSDIPRTFVKGTYRFPTIIGHEFAGWVEALGPEVSGLAVGEPVVVFPLIGCGRCAACSEGHEVQCRQYDYLGSRRDGALAEFVVAPARNLLPVPPGVPLTVAAMTEPAAVARHALRRGGEVDGVVAIFGAGPIGLMAAQWAQQLGAERVLLFDIAADKLALAHRLGFAAFDSRTQDPVTVIHDHTDGEGAHLCLEAAGVPATLLQALAAVRRHGRVVLMGNPEGAVTLPAERISQFMRREAAVFGTWNSRFVPAGRPEAGSIDDDWRQVLTALADGRLQLEPLISHRVPLAQAFATLRLMHERREGFVKVLVAGADFA